MIVPRGLGPGWAYDCTVEAGVVGMWAGNQVGPEPENSIQTNASSSPVTQFVLFYTPEKDRKPTTEFVLLVLSLQKHCGGLYAKQFISTIYAKESCMPNIILPIKLCI